MACTLIDKTIYDDGMFKVFLKSLIETLDKYIASILIFSPDDTKDNDFVMLNVPFGHHVTEIKENNIDLGKELENVLTRKNIPSRFKELLLDLRRILKKHNGSIEIMRATDGDIIISVGISNYKKCKFIHEHKFSVNEWFEDIIA